MLAEHSAVSSAEIAVSAGLPEAEDRRLVEALATAAVAAYHAAMNDSTREWLSDADLTILDEPIDAPAALTRVGVDEAGFPWLHRMWSGKTGAFLAQWEAVGHQVNHLGEMVAVRNKMGLSPF